MLDSISNSLRDAYTEPLGLLLALLLGMISAATTACCALPVVGMIIGYSGGAEIDKKSAFKKSLKKTVFFTMGAIIALMLLGAIAGFIGQTAQANLGQYWQIFAGIVMIIFGLFALKLVPFKLNTGKLDSLKKRLGSSSNLLSGLILGGIIAVTSMCCNPAIFVVMGVAIIQEHILSAVFLIFMYSIGFTLPVGAILFGITYGKARFLPKGANTVVRWIAGGILVVVGFYFLITL